MPFILTIGRLARAVIFGSQSRPHIGETTGRHYVPLGRGRPAKARCVNAERHMNGNQTKVASRATFVTALCAAWLALAPAGALAQAQPAPATPAAPSTPGGSTPPPAVSPPTAAPLPAAPSTAQQPADESGAETLDVAARPVALMRGSSSWDDGFKS